MALPPPSVAAHNTDNVLARRHIDVLPAASLLRHVHNLVQSKQSSSPDKAFVSCRSLSSHLGGQAQCDTLRPCNLVSQQEEFLCREISSDSSQWWDGRPHSRRPSNHASRHKSAKGRLAMTRN